MSKPNNMIKRLSICFISLAVVFAACKSEKETPSGLKYTVHKAGDGVRPKKEQITVFNYVLKDDKDSVWSDTFNEGIPAASMTGDSSRIAQEDGMTQMFRMLSVGDSVSVSMKVGEFFRKLVGAPVPPNLDSTRTITYIIKVNQITSMEEYQSSREMLRTLKSMSRRISLPRNVTPVVFNIFSTIMLAVQSPVLMIVLK
jgi:FKBP-type peptidyl-prolyl cis-trans isomerase FkpA